MKESYNWITRIYRVVFFQYKCVTQDSTIAKKERKKIAKWPLCRGHDVNERFRYSPFYYLNFLLYNSNKQFSLAML